MKISLLMSAAYVVLAFLPSHLVAQQLEEEILSCNDGNAEACFRTAELLSSGRYHGKSLRDTANEVAFYYKKACDAGSAEGCRAFAMNYASGKSYDAEHKGMAYFFRKACDMGDETACTLYRMIPEKPSK